MTQTASETLQACALAKNDNPRLSGYVSGVTWDVIVAVELRYHQSCYALYTKNSRPLKESKDVFQKLFDAVKERVLKENEVLKVTDLSTNQNERWTRCDNRTIVDAIKKEFGEEIGIWNSKHKRTFLYNNTLEKGRIVELLQTKVEKLTNASQNKQSFSDKLKEVGKAIRVEIQESESTFKDWPPSESELYSKQTQIPAELFSLLRTILAKPGRISKRKNIIIKSIAQDILYNASGGKLKTLKHILLPFSVKRRTGSKEILRWISKLGHGVCYDDIIFLESSLANDAFQGQSMKSFCPASIQPSTFITFIWDNNDINPESFSGQVMHCTNGIAVQLRSNGPPRLADTSILRVCGKKRQRTFKALPNTIATYFSQKRYLPSTISNLNEVLTPKKFGAVYFLSGNRFSLATVKKKYFSGGKENHLLYF